MTGLPFNLKQDRTSECDELKEGRPHERCMANILVEHHLPLEPHEIFPETHTSDYHSIQPLMVAKFFLKVKIVQSPEERFGDVSACVYSSNHVFQVFKIWVFSLFYFFPRLISFGDRILPALSERSWHILEAIV